MAALISQANSWHQMKETKQLKPTQNPKRLPTFKHKVERKKTYNPPPPPPPPPNHSSLIDYCLQQKSGQLQSEEHREKITAKQMESQTNSKLTWLLQTQA